MPLDRWDPRPCCVYRWFAPTGQLLYVGAAVDPVRRFKQLKATGDWIAFATRHTIEWFDCVRDAHVVETEAIKTEAPLFNMLHKAGYLAPTPGGPRPTRDLELGDGTVVRFTRDDSRNWRVASAV